MNSRKQAYWQSHLEQYEVSGLSGAQYCRQAQLVYHNFAYWRRKSLEAVIDDHSDNSPFKNEKSGFIAVRPPSMVEPSAETESLQLSLPNGLVIQNIQINNLSMVRLLLEHL